MNFPPPGYDDESLIPQQRLKLLLGTFQAELDKIQQVFQQHLPGQFQMPQKIERDFWSLRIAAEELGTEYSFLIEKLISDYNHFKETPDQQSLNRVFSDIKNLQLLLVG